MKKLLIIIAFCLSNQLVINAQITDGQLNEQMEQMTMEMEKLMLEFGFNNPNSRIKIDTLFFKGANPFSLEEGGLGSFEFSEEFSEDLLQLLEKQMKSFFGDSDLQFPVDSLFRNFSYPAPVLPDLDSLEKGEKKTKKKKRKVYSL